MIVAIPVNNNSIESGVCPSFGRAPYFLFFRTETEEYIFHKNSAAASRGGAGISAAQFIVDQKAGVLLSPRCGENAASVILNAGVKIYKTFSNSVTDNIKALINGELPLLNEIHAGFHNHGGR